MCEFYKSLKARETKSRERQDRGENRVIPFWANSSSSPLHSSRKMLAPVRLPSPPITHTLVMPSWTRLRAAFKRPSRLRKALQRALPIIVPPWKRHKITFTDFLLTGQKARWISTCTGWPLTQDFQFKFSLFPYLQLAHCDSLCFPTKNDTYALSRSVNNKEMWKKKKRKLVAIYQICRGSESARAQ